mgnify:CR=1 FL=1
MDENSKSKEQLATLIVEKEKLLSLIKGIDVVLERISKKAQDGNGFLKEFYIGDEYGIKLDKFTNVPVKVATATYEALKVYAQDLVDSKNTKIVDLYVSII